MSRLKRYVLHYELAYGFWKLKDGTIVLYNRDYHPIWHKQPGEDWERYPDRNSWVDEIAEQHWFYGGTATEKYLVRRRSSKHGYPTVDEAMDMAIAGMMAVGFPVSDLARMRSIRVELIAREIAKDIAREDDEPLKEAA
jgi:hypothetical protein